MCYFSYTTYDTFFHSEAHLVKNSFTVSYEAF